MTQRKGAKRIQEVSLEVKAALEAGTLPTANLTEWLAVDLQVLLKTVFAQVALENYLPSMILGLQKRSKEGVLKKMTWIGQEMAQILSSHPQKEDLFRQFATHVSDVARCWAAFSIATDPSLEMQLKWILPFAADPHFGVRECAWMAVRPTLAKHLEKGISLLRPFVKNNDYRIRRFAVEITRPRGVWCAHLNELKQYPERGLPLLEPVRADPEKYVQDSVANWLNDASKSQPDWVQDVCERWIHESPSSETQRIVKRARRTIQ